MIMYGIDYEFMFHVILLGVLPVIGLGFGFIVGIYSEITSYKSNLDHATGKVESVHSAIIGSEELMDKRFKKLEARVENTEMFIQSRGK